MRLYVRWHPVYKLRPATRGRTGEEDHMPRLVQIEAFPEGHRAAVHAMMLGSVTLDARSRVVET